MTRWPTSGMMGSIRTKTILEENLYSTVTAVTRYKPIGFSSQPIRAFNVLGESNIT